MNASTSVVRLYSKPGCHLCEQAEAELAHLRRRYPHTLQRIDITTDPRLVERFGERIPVVVIADREYAAPLRASELERALEAATRAAAAAGLSQAPDAHASPSQEPDTHARLRQEPDTHASPNREPDTHAS
jgi:hypothetical protein